MYREFREAHEDDNNCEPSGESESNLLELMYKLTYFGVRGRAEPIRYLFAAASQKYEDVRVTYEEWIKLKPTTKTKVLPFVNTPEGQILTESMAIARYFAKKYDMMGGSLWEYYLCERAMSQAGDIQLTVSEKYFHTAEDKRAEFFDEYMTQVAPQQLANLVLYLKENGTGFVSGSKVTLGDICIMGVVDLFKEYELLNGRLDGYPELLEHYDRCCSSIPAIRAWIQSRPHTDM